MKKTIAVLGMMMFSSMSFAQNISEIKDFIGKTPSEFQNKYSLEVSKSDDNFGLITNRFKENESNITLVKYENEKIKEIYITDEDDFKNFFLNNSKLIISYLDDLSPEDKEKDIFIKITDSYRIKKDVWYKNLDDLIKDLKNNYYPLNRYSAIVTVFTKDIKYDVYLFDKASSVTMEKRK